MKRDMGIIDGIIAKIDRLKRLLELKDAKIEKLERLKKAREEDVEYLEKQIEESKISFEKIIRSNKELSSSLKCKNAEVTRLERQVAELKEEEKSNGNWAREGAVVWHGKQKVKGVLLANEQGDLYVMAFKHGKGFNTPFKPYMWRIEPYKGQDKEEVQDVIFENTIEVGEIWQSNGYKNRVVLITQIDNIDESTQELKVMNLKTWERAEKGTTQFLRGDYLLKKFTKKTLD